MAITKEQAAGRIMVALDYPNWAAAEKLLNALEGIPCWMKVGMELIYAEGLSIIGDLRRRGYRVFVDLKLHDIPNTVRGGIASLTRHGANMLNVHAAGGRRMLEAAREGLEQGLQGSGSSAERPLLIAVTQLTSTSRETMNGEIGIPGTVEDTVVRYARMAAESGLDGVVSSPLEVRIVKEACGDGFITVTPGIRPAGSDIGDQSRIMTPGQAIAAGTDYMVIGRAITAAADPRASMEAILDELVAHA
ncbi:orotidine-5'-phosphate decarboxylase [Paenibacillus thermoaerophilus]|uniref:Orotidine 5'-phosphate decarboxylase n=1 Tax=Paenibacillus thermoaerophilus TaxID=1215385 RepID=A0ABW2V379_9BACL|nr:orotidine-5'-phosphate decarboxylase [Paenibacillus thermoaerophilus]TMV19109.1 orotidine-5'-phosphate decarboxylase [Paenibacillus thermoaerophilus]